MRTLTKVYLASVLIVGVFALSQAYAAWSSTSSLRFFTYLALTTVGSGMKITLPSVRSTMSVNFFFVLLAIAQLSMGETVVIAAVGFLVQYYWKAKSKRKLIQTAFNLSTASVAAAISWKVFHSEWLSAQGVEFPLLMTAAACTYFLANTTPIATIIALTEGKGQVLKTWRECYLWAFPYYMLGASLAGALYWGSKVAGWQVAILGLPSLYVIYRSYNTYLQRLEGEKRHAESQRQHAESISALHLRTIEALALAIEAKDQTTHDHLQRVQIYAMAIGKEMNLDELEMEALRAASVLHDIGKLAVPEHIISKPGKLTPEEFEKMKIHPTVGAEILEHVRFPYPVVPIVRAHHEKWDGTGYPAGLKGEEIPVGARILAAVDCFDALCSDRQYRRALPIDQALAYVVSEAGKSFNPQVVEILARRHKELEARARAEGPQRPQLSTELRIVRGEAPAAGFEKSLPLPTAPGTHPVEFVERIGAARQEAQVLFEITGDMGRSLSLDATLSILSSGLARLVPFEGLAVYLQRERVVKCEFATGKDARLFSALEIPVGHGLSGWVVQNQKPIVNGNPTVEPGYLNDARKFTLMRSALSVPLDGASGTIGALTLYDTAKDAFTRDHLRIVQAISSKLGISIENALKYREAEDGSVLDFLTQLPNARALFMKLQEEVHHSRKENLPVTILVGDLDGFKAVNDHYGHLEGDRVLQLVASALKKQCRARDYVARMGGDEFAIILGGVTEEEAVPVAERFRQSVEDVTQDHSVSLSLGSATFGGDGEHPEELLVVADRRMYKAKRERKAVSQDLVRLAEVVRQTGADPLHTDLLLMDAAATRLATPSLATPLGLLSDRANELTNVE